jgi:BNR repeat protein
MARNSIPGALAAALLCSCGGGDEASRYVGPAFFTNVVANQDASGLPQNETSIAINPEDRGNLVGGWNDYRDGVSVHVGFGSTRDGGATWTDGLVPEPEHAAQGDPAVAASADGDFYMALISFERFGNAGGIYVSRSEDGGRTFQRAVRVQADAQIFEDKEYIAVDRSTSSRRGTVYVSWTDFDDLRFRTEIMVSSSSDRGTTWSAPVSVSGPMSYSRGFVQGSVPAVGENGVLYVAWYEERGDFAPLGRDGWPEHEGPPHPQQVAWRRVLGVGQGLLPPLVRKNVPGLDVVPNRMPGARRLAAAEGARILVARSTDGGRSFGTPEVAATVEFLPSNLPFRINGFPSLSVVSNGLHFLHSERIYVAYATGVRASDSGPIRDSDVFVVSSKDGARSFGAPVRVDDDASGAVQVFPWVAADETGAVHLVWYDRRDDPRGQGVSLYYSKSVDAGSTFSANRRVSPGPFSPFTDFDGEFIGDYNGVAAAGGVAYALWTDTRRGGEDIFYAPLQ